MPEKLFGSERRKILGARTAILVGLSVVLSLGSFSYAGTFTSEPICVVTFITLVRKNPLPEGYCQEEELLARLPPNEMYWDGRNPMCDCQVVPDLPGMIPEDRSCFDIVSSSEGTGFCATYECVECSTCLPQ